MIFMKYSKFLSAGLKKKSCPSATFQDKVAKGLLQEDEFQFRIATHFDKLFRDLINYAPAPKWKKLLFASASPEGLYLYGSVGRGKTMMMDIFYDCCLIKRKRRVHYNEFMSDVHSRIHTAKKNKPVIKHKIDHSRSQPWDPISPVAADIFQQAWVLCLDEFQVTDIADAMIIMRLFSELFKQGTVVVATSNRAPDDLYKHGLQRTNFLPFIPLLKSRCKVVNLNAPTDYRTKGVVSSEQHYFLVEQSNKNDQLERIFKVLTGEENCVVSSKTIKVNGRHVILPRVCGGVLDATFNQLCDQALGSADYLKLAQMFHTIIIRNVPQMNLNYRNQARRFIQLIDIFYEYRVRVVISAEVAPQDLFSNKEISPETIDAIVMDDLQIAPGKENDSANIYTGSEEVFAFERTVSRLLEMQTAAYWGQRQTN